MSSQYGDRPTHLPITESVWLVAQSYDPNGPTVRHAMYEAIKSLETELQALKQAPQ